MQIDMHYHGTFALACAAGFPAADAQIIATASQTVDDNNHTRMHELGSQEAIQGVATAHHPLEAGKRVMTTGSDDSRLVWVPFHFLPANLGSSFEERLVCGKNSEVANAMMAYYTRRETVDAHRGHALHLLGIGAHVFADTFSHHGFSGIASPLNHVAPDSIQIGGHHSQGIVDYVLQRAKDFADRFAAEVAGAVNLGHGAVATYPDRPFLSWSYVGPHGRRVLRDNAVDFEQGCRALFDHFLVFRQAFYADAPSAAAVASFAQIEEVVRAVLATEGTCDVRAEAWGKALANGSLGTPQTIPPYEAATWLNDLLGLDTLTHTDGRVDSDAYNFFTAAEYHRNYVLKRLLPECGLFVA